MYLQRTKPWRWLVSLVLTVMLFGCSEIRLIGAYDQTIDEGIQKLSKDIATLLVRVEKNAADGDNAANKYSNFRETYIDLQGQVKTLKVRAGALSKYGKVKEQIDAVETNIDLLEKLHKSGFALPPNSPVKVIQNIRDQFELSFTTMLAAQNALKREKIEDKK